MRIAALFTSIALMFGSCGSLKVRLGAPVPKKYDSEFLYWCLPDDGGDGIWTAHNEDQHCRRSSRASWKRSQFPLSLNTEAKYAPQVIEAAKEINEQLGFDVFYVDPTDREPDVFVAGGSLSLFINAKVVRFTAEGRSYAGVMVHTLNVKTETIVHELGHILGLQHDNNLLSVMHPVATGLTSKFERADVYALRLLYAPR